MLLLCRLSIPFLGLVLAMGPPAQAGARWRELLPTTIRTGAAFDPARHWMILPGHTTWVLDLSAGPSVPAYWVQLPYLGTPPPDMQDAMVAFDPGLDAVILYAPQNSSPSRAIWILHLGTPAAEWTHLDPSSPPPPRDLPTAVYDASAHRVLRFGGRTPGSYSSLSYKNDLWQASVLYASAFWSPVATQGAPGGRADATAAYDTLQQCLLLFGGQGPDQLGSTVYLTDVWALTFSNMTWNPVTASETPPDAYFGDHNYQSFYDEAQKDLVVMWTGLWGDSSRTAVWRLWLGASPTWLLQYDSFPAGDWVRYDSRVAFDPVDRRLLLHGGRRSRRFFPTGRSDERRTDTWQLALDTTTPSPVPGAGQIPSPRDGSTLTYDPVGKRFLLVGGFRTYTSLSDVWLFDPKNPIPWTSLGDGSLPPRAYHTTVYDSFRQRMVVFGGYDGMQAMNDVWQLGTGSGSSWMPILASGTPPAPRYAHTAIYDPIGDRMILFGGSPAWTDTWSLLLSPSASWAQTLGPGPPNGGSAVFDPTPGRMVLVGGNGLWTLDLRNQSSWTEVFDLPGPATELQAAYDPVGDRTIRLEASFTGSARRVFENALGEPPSQMVEIPVDGPSPGVNPGPALGYDDATMSLYVFGGRSSAAVTGYPIADQTFWRLDLEPVPEPSIHFVDAQSYPHHAQVTWQVHDAVGAGARVDRESGGAWQRIGSVPSDANGFITIDDSTVSAFQTYTYRAAVPTPTGEIVGGEVQVTVPGGIGRGSALQLYGPRTNPTSHLDVVFSLPETMPAKLVLLDLRGRIVASMDVGSLGPGTHSVRIVPEQPVRSGVYFLRLTQGTAESRQNVVLIGPP